jgi:hypothetical protein
MYTHFTIKVTTLLAQFLLCAAALDPNSHYDYSNASIAKL